MNHTALQSAVSPDTLAALRSIISKNGDDNTLMALAGILAESGKPKTAQSILVARTEALIETPITEASKELHQKALQQAFDRVKNPQDWKAPISANVLDSQMDITIKAIPHFTATHARFVQVGRNDKGEAIFHVTAPGYRAGPAGDH